MQEYRYLNQYQIVREVGRGSMGSVFEAEQLGAEGFTKSVAIKVVAKDFEDQPEFTRMFIGEAKLVADLIHPNIVQIYQLGRHGQTYFICMELIEGVDLRSFVARHRARKRPIPIEVATFIVSRVARALEYAHSKHDRQGNFLGLVHRDVSNKNIMISSEGEVKLTDFGMAKARKFLEGNEGDKVMGSLEFMSPEQAGGGQTSAASDIFSLGLVYYELLTQTSALQASSVSETLMRLMTGKFAPAQSLREDLSDELSAILARCLKHDPRERYSSAGELSYALEYELYRHGYGPTIVSMATHLAELFPERNFRPPVGKIQL